MNYFKGNNIKTWLIIILLTANIAIIASFLIQTKKVSRSFAHNLPSRMEMPKGGMNALFIDELNLSKEQLILFADFRREFQHDARIIQENLETERVNFINELSKEQPRQEKLDESIDLVGEYHKELKHLTATYYLNLKNTCNTEQKEKLKFVFIELSSPNAPNMRNRGEMRGRGMEMNRGPRGPRGPRMTN